MYILYNQIIDNTSIFRKKIIQIFVAILDYF